MANHLSTVGFAVESPDDFMRLAEAAGKDAVEIRVKGGRYRRWSGAAFGAELWIQLDGRGQLLGMQPHFSGRSSTRIAVKSRIRRPRNTRLDGALLGWASPSNDADKNGAYPLVFDLPDAAVYADLQIPAIVTAQISAFAHDVRSYPTPAAYDAAKDGPEPHLASRAFIPAGMFSAEGKPTKTPDAYAILTGHVVETNVQTNSMSGREFYWALVDTYGGQYDVVADTTLLPAPPVVGGVLSGEFWLSGRLRDDYPRRASTWWSRLRGR
jgi:hypothetical protein